MYYLYTQSQIQSKKERKKKEQQNHYPALFQSKTFQKLSTDRRQI